jgi:hypothetical protein
MGEFFQAMSKAERQQIAVNTDRNAALLRDWAQRYALIRPERIPTVALLTATVAPRTRPIDALPTMQLSLWISGVEDIADERIIPLTELRRRIALWYEAALSNTIDTDRPAEYDELTLMLLEIRSALAQYPLFSPLQRRWAFEVRRLVETMAQEYEAGAHYQTRGPQALPLIDNYLSYGTYSSGVPLWACAAWIVVQDDSVLNQLELVTEATRQAGLAVRLYNDLTSFDKERQEKNVNAVLIAQQFARRNAARDSLAEAKRSIRRLADSYGQASLALARRIHTTSGQIEEMLRRAVEFQADFYRDNDVDAPALRQRVTPWHEAVLER